MGSTGKKRTTMAKLNREAKLREKRVEKRARKAARRSSGGIDIAEAVSRPEDLGSALPGLDGSGSDGPGAESVGVTSDASREA